MRAVLLGALAGSMLLIPGYPAFSSEVGRGTYEVTFRGDLTNIHASGGSVTLLVLEPSVGYFVSDAVEAGVTARLAMGNGDFLLRALGFASLHFARTQNLLYYLGIRAGGTGFDEADQEALLGAFVGEKLLVAGGRAAFTVEPYYLLSIPHQGARSHSYGVTTGLSVFFH